MQTETMISERQACRLVGIYRSTLRYEAGQTAEHQSLSARIVELAQERRRFGYRRIHALLRREGHEVNHKRVGDYPFLTGVKSRGHAAASIR